MTGEWRPFLSEVLPAVASYLGHRLLPHEPPAPPGPGPGLHLLLPLAVQVVTVEDPLQPCAPLGEAQVLPDVPDPQAGEHLNGRTAAVERGEADTAETRAVEVTVHDRAAVVGAPGGLGVVHVDLLQPRHHQVQVEVAGSRHTEPFYELVIEDLLDLPAGLVLDGESEVEGPAGSHRRLQATEESLEVHRAGNRELMYNKENNKSETYNRSRT